MLHRCSLRQATLNPVVALPETTGMRGTNCIKFGRGWPVKIHIDNTNLLLVVDRDLTDTGTKRETFVACQLREAGLLIEAHPESYSLVNSDLLIEFGSPNKAKSAKRSASNISVVVDEIEIGIKNEKPLISGSFYLFPFMSPYFFKDMNFESTAPHSTSLTTMLRGHYF